MIKIGVIFFGLPRDTSVTLPSIKRYILDILDDYEVFIESCFSWQEQVVSVRSGENGAINESNYDFFKSHSHQFLTPSQLLDLSIYEQISKFGDPWCNGGVSLRNLLMQLNCIKKAYLQCKENNCDFYFFVRPDIVIEESIPINLFFAKGKNKNAALIPSWQWHEGGVNDRFAIVTKSSADAYALRYDHVLEYCKSKGLPLHSESLLAYQFKRNNVKIWTFPAKMSRVRLGGVVKEECFSMINQMGPSKSILQSQLSQIVLKDRYKRTLFVSRFLVIRFTKAVLVKIYNLKGR